MKKGDFDVNDFLFIAGLVLIGAGLFLWQGPGVAMVVDGALMFVVSIFAAR